ncbi:MAG: DNA polymerase III subunit delta, partial [Bacilli bacterium]|nr:DNA polymerase III subunit delta [Bacilli bacterium]
MANNYFIENNDNFLIEEKIKEIIKKEKFNDVTPTTYDLELTSLENALEDLDTYSFLTNKKVIIIRGLDKIVKKNLDYDIDSSLDHLYKYLKNSVEDNLLIIRVNKSDSKQNMYKKLKSLCSVEEIKIDIKKIVQDKLKDYKLEKRFIDYLIEYCNNDITKISNEVEKLKNYRLEEKELTIKDIDDLVIKEYGDSKNLFFSFLENVGKKDIENSLKSYRELKNYDINDLGLLTSISNQVRLMYTVKVYEEKNYSNDEIAKRLNAKPYRIMKIRELTRLYTLEEIRGLMIKLEEIDLKSKSTDESTNSL